MLRWCQLTLRVLDGHGSKSALSLRHIPRVPFLNRFATSYFNKCFRPRSWNESLTRRISTQSYANGRVVYKQYVHEPADHGASTDLQVENNILSCLPSNLDRQPQNQDEQPPEIEHTFRSKALMLCDCSSDMPHPQTTDNPDTTDPIIILQQLLSHRPLKDRDISDIVSSYERASAESMLSSIDAEQFTVLLSLIGSLSLSSDGAAHAYSNPLGIEFQSSLEKPYLWSFILELGEDKERMGYTLSAQDRYWIMLACLARTRIAGVKSRAAIRHARSQYQSLKTLTDDPNIHMSYLQFLVSSGNHKHLQEAVHSLCEILQQMSDPHPRFPELLWEIILVRAAALSVDLKEKITQVVFSRLSSLHSVIRSPSTATPRIHDNTNTLRVSYLSRAFAAALFPCYAQHPMENLVSHWIIEQARQAFARTLPLDIQWNNLVLLALSISPKTFAIHCKASATVSPDSGNSLWRTTLILESLERKLTQSDPDLGRMRQTVQGISRSLWNMFATVQHAEQPVDITLAYVATFFRIAAYSYDEHLKEECFRLSQQLQLWHYLKTDSPTTRAQVVDNIAAYAKAFVSCEGHDWARLYTTISSLAPDTDWQADVTKLLLQYYALERVSIAYDLYVHSVTTGINISYPALSDLLLGLVKHQRWDIVTLFLKHPTTSPDHIELLFGESIRVFQVQRYEYVDRAFVKLLAQTADKLYEHQRPSSSLKYPLRYFFSMIIWTQNTSELVKIVEAIYRTAPTFFTRHIVQRLVLQLVRRQDLSVALQLFRVFESAGGKSTSLSVETIRHMLFLRFMKSGAHNLAKQLSQSSTSFKTPAKRDAPVNASGSRRLPPTSMYFHSNFLAGDNYTLIARETISLLIQTKRFYAARKLYAKLCTQLDPKASTAVGNIILHGLVQGQQFRQGRLVRHMFRTKDLLSRDYGFVPDRTTVNIILKATLRWTSAFDAEKVRNLFDALVHEGYPVAEQFRRKHGVPFSSPHSPSGLNIPSLSVHISFSKHIRPMYRMFIKAFYLRGDVAAAKTVVGILKEEEVRDMREREKRNRARREGVVKKRMKEMGRRQRSTL